MDYCDVAIISKYFLKSNIIYIYFIVVVLLIISFINSIYWL